MKDVRTIWRIENPSTGSGMWYDAAGNFNPVITDLTDCKSAHLPMGFNNQHKLNGKDWYSGVPDHEMLKHWFSKMDVKELLERGYLLYELIITE